MLKNYDYKEIMKKFPNIELSYEKNLHKKVQADIYLTIPKGKKYFAWFKNYKNNNYCFMMNINRKNNSIIDINNNICSFDYSLCSGVGTILYGTIFQVNKNKFFNIEDIYYIKGRNVAFKNQYFKINEMINLMKNYIRQKSYNRSIIFGCPNITTSYYDMENIIKNVPYDLYCIQLRTLYRNKPYLNKRIQKRELSKVQKVFKIKATIINDIYNLFCLSNGKYEKYDIANIPDYKTSVFMNSIFRNIKENINLDALEESDDEEEFEDISVDKFVNLEKEVFMICEYNSKFKSWQPLSITKNKPCEKREITIYKKK